MSIENQLKALFDFQRFEKNQKLEQMIERTVSGMEELTDDDLSLINAAGDVTAGHGGGGVILVTGTNNRDN